MSIVIGRRPTEASTPLPAQLPPVAPHLEVWWSADRESSHTDQLTHGGPDCRLTEGVLRLPWGR
jgi:hypothetical protein